MQENGDRSEGVIPPENFSDASLQSHHRHFQFMHRDEFLDFAALVRAGPGRLHCVISKHADGNSLGRRRVNFMPNSFADKPVDPNRNGFVTRNGIKTCDSQLPAGLDPQILRVADIASQEPCIVGPLRAKVLAGLNLHSEFTNPVKVFSKFFCQDPVLFVFFTLI